MSSLSRQLNNIWFVSEVGHVSSVILWSLKKGAELIQPSHLLKDWLAKAQRWHARGITACIC